MKKHFLISALCILSFFNLQSSDLKTTITSSYMPFAYKWFNELKAKHADAGFDSWTYLISVEKQNPSNVEKMFSTWAASSTETPIESNWFKGKIFKNIYGKKEDLTKLNSICEKLYSKSEILSQEEEQFLDEVSGIFLHEIYHCNRTTKIPSNPILKIFDRRREEYEADMHAIKHGTTEEIQALISSLQRNDEILRKNFIVLLDIPIYLLKSLESKSCSYLKPFFTKLIDMFDSLQNIHHPSVKTRIQYFSAAITKKQEEKLLINCNHTIKALLATCLLNHERNDSEIDPSEFQSLSKRGPQFIIDHLNTTKPQLVTDAEYFKNNEDMINRILSSNKTTPLNTSGLLAAALKKSNQGISELS